MNKKEVLKNKKEINNIEDIKKNEFEENFNDNEDMNNLKINEINEEEVDETNTLNNILDANFIHYSNYNKCVYKKLCDFTKNTIDNILTSLLNDMEKDKNKYQNKKLKRMTYKHRLKSFNFSQKIDIIEKEDKESLASEIPKEKKIDNINSNQEYKKNKEEISLLNIIMVNLFFLFIKEIKII